MHSATSLLIKHPRVVEAPRHVRDGVEVERGEGVVELVHGLHTESLSVGDRTSTVGRKGRGANPSLEGAA